MVSRPDFFTVESTSALKMKRSAPPPPVSVPLPAPPVSWSAPAFPFSLSFAVGAEELVGALVAGQRIGKGVAGAVEVAAAEKGEVLDVADGVGGVGETKAD